MTRKLFKFWGIGILFTVLFLACRADNEGISKNESKNSKYVSKSLWKEDELYIKNVMQIYDEHETELQKKSGTPQWNYAITSGYFDESYLKVPVLKENKVIGILQVKRQKDVNKVYFYYDENQNEIDFFQTLIFDKRHKKPFENVIKTSDPTNKMTTVECVTTSFEVGCLSSQSDCIPMVKETTTCTVSHGDGGGGGDGNGGGGYDYPPPPPHGGGGGGNPNGTQNPCEKSKLPATKATLNSQTTAFSEAKTSIAEMNNGKENGVVLGNDNGTIQSTGVQTGGESSNESLTFNFSNPIGDIHNHPNNNPPSTGDFYSLINSRNQYSNYNTRYVITKDGTTYALVVTDKNAMNAFLQNYPPSIIPNPKGGNFVNFPLTLNDEYNDVAFDINSNNQQSYEFALSYILDKYNSGIALTKMDNSGNFKKINVTSTLNSDGTTTYQNTPCQN